MSESTHLPSPAATLDIDVMKTLVVISETGSLTAAAARVARSPGALSMQIKKLEETLGLPLFERSRQGMALNESGERLLVYARRMTDLHREALEAFRMPELTGEVRVGVSEFGGMRLSDVLAAFAHSYAQVTVDVHMGSSKEIAAQLEHGDVDLAVLSVGSAVREWSSDKALHEEPLVWVSRDGDAVSRQRPLPLACAAPGCAWRRAAREALERVGIPYRIAYISEFSEAQRAAILAGLAIAPLPRSTIGTGMMQIRASEGLPKIGKCRVVLRLGPDSSTATLALADRIAESYGAELPDLALANS